MNKVMIIAFRRNIFFGKKKNYKENYCVYYYLIIFQYVGFSIIDL